MDETDTNRDMILLRFIEKMKIKKQQKPEDFVISLLKKKNRVQLLLQSSLSKKDLNGYSELDIKLLGDDKLIKEASVDRYILTIKGLLKAISLVNSEQRTEAQLYQNFLEEFFDSEFKVSSTEKPLDYYEKTWLFCMILLNCFDLKSAIDVNFNKSNKEVFSSMFNKVGEFLKQNGFETQFKSYAPGDEILRRELESINKKIYNVTFSKDRARFYIDLARSGEKLNTLIGILRKIFSKIDGSELTLDDTEKISKLSIECEPFFYKVKRHDPGISLKPLPIVDEALKKLI